DQLETDLRALIDPVTSQPAVQSVTRAAGGLCEGPPTELPDLFVDWRPVPHERTMLLHPRARVEQKRQRYNRDSFHSNVGFVAAAGPAIDRRGEIGALDLLDLAPTWLTLMGEPVPDHLTGRPVEILCRHRRTVSHT